MRAAAARHGLTVAFAADTHLHADFLSGARQLAADDGAQILASAAGRRAFGHRGLADGDEVDLGGLTLRAWATPGHTAEHLRLPAARRRRRCWGCSPAGRCWSARRPAPTCPARSRPSRWPGHSTPPWAGCSRLPDATPVYPTHGAGSFCSAPPGAERTTTIGRERAANPLLAAGDEDAFVTALLAGLGTFPGYFLRLPEQNRRGPAILASAPALAPLTPAQVRALQDDGGQVVDVRPVADYAAGHIPGSLAIPLRDAFATWLGWLVPDPATPLVIVADPGQDLGEVIWQALKIGYENLAGTLAGGMPAWEAAGQPVAATPLLAPGQVDPAAVIDVRQASEYAGGHLPGARNIELGALTSQAAERGGPAGRDHVRARRARRHRRQRAGAGRAHRRGGPARRPAGLGGRHRAGAGEHRVTAPDPRPAAAPGPAPPGRPAPGAGVRLGLRANLAQFSLLVAVNALVGGTLGQERTVVPLLAEQTFHLAAFSSALTFILAFGAVKAVTNFFAGTLSDRFGRKPVLVAGWLAALPIPPLLIWAPNWGWVVAANVLLGVNQGLTWSTTVIMKIDLVGPARRGLAMGLNEAAGYGAVAVTALATGYLAAAYGLRPAPFLLGAAYIALGLGLSAAAVRETRGHARHEAATHVAAAGHLGGHLTTRQVAWLTSFSEPALSAACQAGHGQQPQRRRRLGPVPDPVRQPRPDRQPDRRPRRPVPGGLGRRAAGHRRAVGPDRPQVAHRRRDAACRPSRSAMVALGTTFTAVGDRRRAARRRHRHGLPHPARRHRRRRPPRLAGPVGRRLPAVARRRVRRRRAAGRRDRRRVRDPRRDLGRRRPHRRLRPHRRHPHVRDPASAARPDRRFCPVAATPAHADGPGCSTGRPAARHA